MLRTLFIADLHLSQKEPAITTGFLHFLQREANTADALYILGDLFETWIGDDDPNPSHKQIAEALLSLPLPVYFIHGNHDFLLGERYARASGIILLPEEIVLNLYGHSVLIMHGDTLCIDDADYQRFRRKVHQRWLQKIFLTLPLHLRQQIVLFISNVSKNVNSQKSMVITDVSAQAVSKIMQYYRVQWLIHGHTHRPKIHALIVNGQPAKRLVLGAWNSYGSMIEVTEQSINLIHFAF